jgi:lysophospholipase L1-like esterase
MKKIKKVSKTIAGFTLIVSVLSSQVTLAAPANNGQAKQSIVSLGDSITFGWNLDGTGKNTHVSKEAFPAIVASEEHFRIRNLGVGDDTSSDLLNLLQTEKYREAIRHADYISVDIGSNDFLQGAKPVINRLLTIPNYQPTSTDYALIKDITTRMGMNLAVIIKEIRSLTDAPIVLYTLYNPFAGYDVQAGGLLQGANDIIKSYDADPSIVVADAFKAFIGKQDKLILPGDVHPNTEGQEVLAQLALDALDSFK